MYDIKISNSGMNIVKEDRVYIKSMINLSSATDEFIEMRLMSVMDQKKAINKFPIIPSIMVSEMTGKLQSRKETRKVGIVFVVDEDDMYKNVKIRNVCIINNCFVLGKIIMVYEKPVKQETSNTGLIMRLATKQISNELCQKIGIARIPKSKKCAKVTLVQFQSKLIGSIAGLTQMANFYELPFDIELRQIIDQPSWIIMPEKALKNICVANTTEITDVNEKIDRDWNRKIYYTDRVTTETTMRKLNSSVKIENSQRNKNRIDLTQIIKNILLLVKIVISLIKTLVGAIQYTFGLLYQMTDIMIKNKE